MSPSPGRTALYHVYDAADLLLYIGISNDFDRRWRQHAEAQPWWAEHRWMRVYWYDTRKEAETAEALAIEAEEPKYNKSGGVLVLADTRCSYSPPAEIEDDMMAVVDWILETPSLPTVEIRLALGRLLHGAPPTDSAGFVRYAVELCGVSQTQAYAAARRRAVGKRAIVIPAA